MPPKTPSELKQQLEEQNAGNRPIEGVERSAEGMELPVPEKKDFFQNLGKIVHHKP